MHEKGPVITNPQEQALKHIIHLIHLPHNTQINNIGFLLTNTPCAKLHPHIQDWLGPIVTLDGPPCGSGAYRLTRCFKNLALNSVIQTKFNILPAPTLTINMRLEKANISHRRTQPTLQQRLFLTKHTPYEPLPHIAVPRITGRTY